jgi:hypothetical protein
MFGFLKKQLQKGVEKLSKKIEESPEVEKADYAEVRQVRPKEKPEAPVEPEVLLTTPSPKKPKKKKPELPASERPIEVREDVAQKRVGGSADTVDEFIEKLSHESAPDVAETETPSKP